MESEKIVMLLTVDIGNTNISYGIFQDDRLAAHGKIPTEPEQSPRFYSEAFCEVLKSSSITPSDLQGAIVGSVVKDMADTLHEAIMDFSGLEAIEAHASGDLGIRVDVPAPERVGIDRLLSAAVAFKEGGGPVVIVDLGSALTVDLVSGDGVFMGGTISPGLHSSLDALHLKTSLLPRVDLSPPKNILGVDTEACILSGVVYGVAGTVEGLVRRIASCAAGPSRTILTGGDSAFLSPYLDLLHDLDPHLLLRGLRLTYQRSRH